jgi:hypothetical protein
MKLSDNTVDILKNFSAINPNMLFRPGSTISTIAEAKNIVASAKISEQIPAEFGIFDLTQFLSTISLLENPELEFTDSSVMVRDGSASIQYYYSSPDVLTVPNKTVNMPNADVVFNLSSDMISKIKRAASVLGHPTLQILGSKGKITLQIVDLKNPTANKYTIVIDEKNACNEVFSFIMVIGNLKMMAGDYVVSVSSKLISHFKNTSTPVEYWIALEKTSTFGK